MKENPGIAQHGLVDRCACDEQPLQKWENPGPEIIFPAAARTMETWLRGLRTAAGLV